MQPQRRRARLLLLASLAASACTEQAVPTSIPDGVNAALTAAAGANNQKVKVKSMQLSANTLRIDGPSVSGTVSIGNSGLAIESNVVIRAEITQTGVSRQAVNTATQCSAAAGDAGKLPTGSCEMTFSAAASNSALGDGILTAGAATFTLHVIQTSNAGDTELASKSLLVNLVGTPTMTVTIAPTSLLIDGPAANATAVIQNPANSLQGVLVQGWIVQGAARRASGGTLVTCGSNAGVLPPRHVHTDLAGVGVELGRGYAAGRGSGDVRARSRSGLRFLQYHARCQDRADHAHGAEPGADHRYHDSGDARPRCCHSVHGIDPEHRTEHLDGGDPGIDHSGYRVSRGGRPTGSMRQWPARSTSHGHVLVARRRRRVQCP